LLDAGEKISKIGQHSGYLDFIKAGYSVMTEVFYNILSEIGIPMKHVTVIKIFLNKT
jgi:hypothetical protein